MRRFRVTIVAVEKQRLLHIPRFFVALVTVCQIFVKFDLVVFYKRGTLLVAQLVKALRYNPEGRGFDSRLGHWNFSST